MSTSDRPTPTLLGICEDIRKMIYELVLQDAEPRIRVSLEDKSRQDTLTNFIEDPTRPANEYWRESSPPKLQAVINGNELLLTCKQVYGELHKTFHRSTVLQVHQSVLCHPYMKALRKAFSKVQAIYIADDQDSDGDDVLIGTVCSIPQPRGTAIILLDIHEVAMEMLWTAQDLHTDRLPQLFRCKKEIAMNGFANGTSHIESQHLHRYLPSAKKFSLASRQLVRIVGRAAVVYILDIGYALERPRAVRLDREERYSAVVAVKMARTMDGRIAEVVLKGPNGEELLNAEHATKFVDSYISDVQAKRELQRESMLWREDEDDAFAMMNGLFQS